LGSLFPSLREQPRGREVARQYVASPKRQYVARVGRQYVTARLLAQHKTVSGLSSRRLVVLRWL
jgi:hypothetical protein